MPPASEAGCTSPINCRRARVQPVFEAVQALVQAGCVREVPPHLKVDLTEIEAQPFCQPFGAAGIVTEAHPEQQSARSVEN